MTKPAGGANVPPASSASGAPEVIAVVGATATGKSAISIGIAEHLIARGTPAEIINGDAMQFYRGMDIGSAKLPIADRRGIVHHLLDTLDVSQDATVAQFQDQARAAIDGIHARGGRAIVVGGSGLYLRALLDKFEFPPTDPEVRAKFETRAAVEGPGVLYRELLAVDPEAASKIQPQNAKRIARALEVIEITGEKFSSSLPVKEYAIPAVQVGLRVPYDVLDERIDARVDQMWADGLVDEVRRLEEQGIRGAITARRAVGYAETLSHLEGELTERQAIDLIAQHTRRLARKQHRWFGPDDRVNWVDGPVDPDDVPRAVGDAIRAAGL
ncbi:tRNA (adenosine(37)-N6)-dimethylallyltransferase MiaA [Demequina oxidasica]|uniref:tRNA (adenosine(37)-N6)-dimethylallyltransferase MiaA n=1 Tax=Demequina oxidasica TaxID=676199 RepID=UPI000B182E29|nr:tRNA (adenosine(37)-N6)-dimethylallyltransferase MiaA [Demequina oxidasica]